SRSRPLALCERRRGLAQRLIVIFSVLRAVFEAESCVFTTSVATNFLCASRAFLRALRVFLVNFTLTVLALPGWRERDAFLPLKRSALAERAAFLDFDCLIVVASEILQACAERSVSFSTFCLRS